MKTVAIVGVGLIGGSFGLALRRSGFTGRILGVSRPEVIQKAVASGAIDAGATLAEAVPQADLVYLAQSISGILNTLPLLSSLLRPDALVTDAGSTKAAIVNTADSSIHQRQFLGGHPLAGKETRGVESADASLFEGRTYVLTPLRNSDLETEPAREFTSWLQKIGAVATIMNPKDHDRTLAFTSHLPQLASTALAAMLSHAGDSVQSAFGPALLDSTRLALSPYEIWKDIIETNHAEVETALDEYIEILKRVQLSVKRGTLAHYFDDGAEFAGQIRRR